MASEKKALIKLLEQSGFYLKRITKHAQYSDGLTRITLPTGGGFSPRLQKMIELQIRDAVKKRGIFNESK